ncbi:flap endonuclease 1-like [Corticium candelabrum]|uniref:flap endonuclease 1-like n=1 Tax=Corticium candelabrum TaxID=121492 RepID=UPI002E25BE01|nr:flap endonuclease 1-like [Corticium candelabrum]
MGIQGLARLIADYAPSAMKTSEMKNYFGRKVAIDASMSIYQFLIAVRQDGGVALTSDNGETTSHLMGMFYRTIRMVENGIKPVYVFDGKPPQLKSGELAKRLERREEAQKALEKAQDEGDQENVEKYQRRMVKATRQHADECKYLLSLMGVPVVQAPCEAEAQCAALVKAGKVYATATEDMDALTFASNVLLRHMTFSEARKMPIHEYHLSKLLEELNFTQEQFIDLGILLGCDYCGSIKGIGPQRAITLLRQHKSIDEILKHIDNKKYPVPDGWLYKEARQLFLEPEITDPGEVELKWEEPDEETLVKYMCEEKGFSEDRIRNAVKKLAKARQSTTQGRVDSFFKVIPNPNKRKDDKPPSGPAKKKKQTTKQSAKTGGTFKRR